jgi:predicted DNA binding protein/putative methionine-R-sulfoxide reductase with GAF domain
MSWLQDHSLDLDVAEEFEDRLNDLCPEYSWVILCQYNRNHFSPTFLDDVIRTHPKFRRESERYPNEYYQRADAPATDPNTIDRKLDAIFTQTQPATDAGGQRSALAALNDATKNLVGADEHETWNLVVDTADEVLDASFVSLWTFDDETGQLAPEQCRPAGGTPTELMSDIQDVAWEHFGGDGPQRFDGEPTGLAADADDTPQTGVAFPIGTDAVLFVATTEQDELSDSDREFTEALVANARTALANHEYEQTLLEQRAELSTRTERVQRLRRISAAFRKVSRVLVAATTREEVLEGVCEQIVDVGSVAFAFVGTYDQMTETVTPQYRAGEQQGYLDAVRTTPDWVDREPTGRAAQTETIHRETDLRAEPPLAQWQKHALKRGFQSVVSLPLVHDDFRYGVLSVYSTTPETFDEEVTAVLREIGDLVAHALSAVEQRRSLVSDSVTELELLVRHDENPAVRLVQQVGCGLELEGVSSGTDHAVRCFVRVRGTRPEAVTDIVKQSKTLEEVSVVSDSGDEQLYDCTVSDDSMTASLLNHGAVPTEFVVEDGEGHLTVRIPRERSVPKFLKMFTAKYPQTELLARRERERPLRSDRNSHVEIEETLSSRQLEVLETAYFSGYFEWPRDRTGEEIAESLGVTQPTVNRHLRAAQRELLSNLLENR